MTSANVQHWIVTEVATGKEVLRLRRHLLCKDKETPQLEALANPYLYHLLINHPDENEADDFVFNGSLEDYLDRVKASRERRRQAVEQFKRRKN